MCRRHGLFRLAVIAGVGTRGYYAKLGYRLEGDGLYMIKDLRLLAPGWQGAIAERAQLLVLALVPALIALIWLWSCEWSAACVGSVLL